MMSQLIITVPYEPSLAAVVCKCSVADAVKDSATTVTLAGKGYSTCN